MDWVTTNIEIRNTLYEDEKQLRIIYSTRDGKISRATVTRFEYLPGTPVETLLRCMEDIIRNIREDIKLQEE
jgi:hypothetical protein